MFSSRLPWDLAPNRLTRLAAAQREAGAKILDLTESNPTRANLSYPAAQILTALADEHSLLYEPTPAGMPSARAAVAEQCGVQPERILLTTSTSESYAWLFKLLGDPGDEILAPRPSYPLFEFLAGLDAVRIAQYPLVYHNGWSLDFDALRRAITERTRAIVLVNPNNPTGSFLKRGEVDELAALAAQHSLALISDEVFNGYAFGEDPRRVTTLAGVEQALTFCLGGLSKMAGLPQMKLGWIVLGGPAALRAQASERLELIADTYLSVGTPVQHALPRLLAAGAAVRQQISARTQENLAWLRTAIAPNSAVQLLDVEGGWYATLRMPRTQSEEEWCLELLERDHVLVQPGYFYDFESEAFLVLSLLTPSAIFREGVHRLLNR
ncbi:MAG: pyridoxal phosphate-dependent aminotransferase [Candidatus Solibacter usitatus]|nr:pyridoxal phosphate-dependent aminotransferase [Candidatus Solibacter usitatus]